MWFLAACDMMVSDYDGNKDDDLVKKKIIYAKCPIAGMKVCEVLEAAVDTLVTAYKSPGGTKENLSWQEHIRHDSNLTSKPPREAKGLEREYLVNGKVINSMEKQDASGEVAPGVTATCSPAASREMVTKARGLTNVLCS